MKLNNLHLNSPEWLDDTMDLLEDMYDNIEITYYYAPHQKAELTVTTKSNNVDFGLAGTLVREIILFSSKETMQIYNKKYLTQDTGHNKKKYVHSTEFPTGAVEACLTYLINP